MVIGNARSWIKQGWFLLLALSMAGSIQAAVTARVDKNPVLVNESFVLEVTSDQSLSGNQFDRTDLLALFKVGRTSVSRQTRIENGKSSQSTVWTTLLLADKAGEYMIPSFEVGGEYTTPISVTVQKGQPQANDADLFLSTEVSNTEIYLGQQLILDVKLYYANALQRGALSDPKIDNAEIEQVGEDSEATELVNGRRYRVISRQYRIQPNTSGEFRLSSPFFEGEVATSTNSNSLFSGFSTGKAVSTAGEDHLIVVHPIPANYQGYWLPSEQVTIEESWQIPNIIKPGEPITRKISLVALGVSEQQLPKLNLEGTQDFAVYPDQAERVTGELNGLSAAQLTQSFAIIANRAGNILIPEVRIPWWDTRTKVQRWATLPARTIRIGDDVTSGASTNKGQRADDYSQDQATSGAADGATDSGTALALEGEQSGQPNTTPWLQWLFLGLWILTAAGWWFTRSKKPSQINSNTNAESSSDAWVNLKTACNNNDGTLILSNLLLWSNEVASKNQQAGLNNISAIKSYFNQPELSRQLDLLQANIYGKSTEPWSGKVILALLKKKRSPGNQEGLPPLN